MRSAGFTFAALLLGGCLQLTPDPPPAFYTPPSPLPAGAPGTVLRSQPITADLPANAVAFRMLYLSTGLAGESVAVSGYVIAPTAPSATPRPVLAWAHGTVGVLPECDLSYTAHPFGQQPRMKDLLDAGFVIAASDYLGIGTPGIHPYLVGDVTARSVIDAVRAAQQLDVGAGDRYVVWGASQGGHAALWTAQLAAAYAPELTLLGAAASAPAIDLAALFGAKLDDQAGGVFLAELLYSWSNVFGFDLTSAVVADKLDQTTKIARTCISAPAGFLLVGGLLTPHQYLNGDVLGRDPWKSKMADNAATGPIDLPLLITHGTADPLLAIGLSQAEADRRCAAGEDVQFVPIQGAAHDAREESGPTVIAWALDRFAGKPTTPTCTPR